MKTHVNKISGQMGVQNAGGNKNGTTGRKYTQTQGWPVGRPLHQSAHTGGEDPVGLRLRNGLCGGQTGADRREKPLRLENLLRTHRPRSLGRPERAGLRGFQPRGKAPGGQHGRKGEGDGRRNQVEARLHPGRESGGHARREPRKGLLGSA